MEMLIPAITGFAFRLPMLVIWIIGLSLAISRRHRHPKVSRLAAIAFVILILISIIDAFVMAIVPMMLMRDGMSGYTQRIGIFYSVKGAIQTIINGIAWALLVAAIFKERGDEPLSNFAPPPPPTYTDSQHTTTGFPQQ
jgi:hypothetical protein